MNSFTKPSGKETLLLLSILIQVKLVYPPFPQTLPLVVPSVWLRCVLSALMIVDIGTGSGQWVIDVANQFPETRVYGIDLSTVHPPYIPSNAEFIVADIRSFSLPENSTDLIHPRSLVRIPVLTERLVNAGIRQDEWPEYMSNVLHMLKPGYGWAQFVEWAHPWPESDNNTLSLESPLSKVSPSSYIPLLMASICAFAKKVQGWNEPFIAW